MNKHTKLVVVHNPYIYTICTILGVKFNFHEIIIRGKMLNIYSLIKYNITKVITDRIML